MKKKFLLILFFTLILSCSFESYADTNTKIPGPPDKPLAYPRATNNTQTKQNTSIPSAHGNNYTKQNIQSNNTHIQQATNNNIYSKGSNSDINYAPYMFEVQKRIKQNWKPPQNNTSNIVLLSFTINSDGNLESCHIKKSSGLKDVDNAAKNAIYLSSPFPKLPSKYGNHITVDYKFDYNAAGLVKNSQ